MVVVAVAEKKDWRGFFFFFPSCCGLVVVVVMVVVAVVVVVGVGVVAVAMADGRGGCGWCCECFFGYWDILFYYSGYNILL